MKRTLLRSALLVPALLLAPSAAAAQSPEEPVWPIRHLAVGNVAFLQSWDPAIQAGYLFQGGMAKSRVETNEFGSATVFPVRWYFHTLASAGWTADRDGLGESGMSGVGQLGLVYRPANDGPLGVNRVGLAAQASYAPRGLGPVARIEFFYGNAALSVGWMNFRGPRGDGIVVSIDLLRCILQDLGLVSTCHIL